MSAKLSDKITDIYFFYKLIGGQPIKNTAWVVIDTMFNDLNSPKKI